MHGKVSAIAIVDCRKWPYLERCGPIQLAG